MFSASINSYFPICIIISNFFENIWVSALISSAFNQIFNAIFKYSIVHLVIETNALIFSAFSKILAVSFLKIFEYMHYTVIPKDYWDRKNFPNMGPLLVNSIHISVLHFEKNKIF